MDIVCSDGVRRDPVPRQVETLEAEEGLVYLSGVSLDEGGRRYRNSLSGESVATARNLYLEDVFGEGRFKLVGEATCSAVIVFALGWSSLIVMPLL